MDPGQGLKSVKVELPQVEQSVQLKEARRFVHRRRAIAIGVFTGVVLWFVHKRHAFTPEPWLDDHPDLLKYGKPDSLSGKETEELFL